MKAQLKKTLALAVVTALLPAQAKDYEAALQRAELIERQEGNLNAARKAYEALLDESAAPQTVHDSATFKLGSLLWRLGERDDARVILTKVSVGGGDLAERAKQLLASESAEAQGKQDRIEQARAILKRFTEVGQETNSPHLLAALRRLGSDAAQAIIEQLNVGPAVRNDGNILNKANHPMLVFMVRELWVIGTEPAQKFLLDAASNGPLPWQRFLTSTQGEVVAQVAADLTPALRKFTQTDDPTGEVWRNATQRMRSLDSDAVATFLASNHPRTREAGLTELGRSWPFLNAEKLAQPFLQKHLQTLRRAFDHRDERLKAATWKVLKEFLEVGPTEASIVFLEEVDAHPDAKPQFDKLQFHFLRGDDTWIHRVAKTARTLGKLDNNEQRPLHAALKELVNKHTPDWTAAASADAATLVQLGYASSQNYANSRWLSHHVKHATAQQRIDLLRNVPNMLEARSLAYELHMLAPTPEFLPAIERILQQCTKNSAIPWLNGSNVSSGIQALAMLAAGCGHADAGRVLADFVMRRPDYAQALYPILCSLSFDRSDSSARSALRQILVLPPSQVPDLAKSARNTIFGELVRAADTESIPLLGKAYALGLAHSGFNYPSLRWGDRRQSRPSLQLMGIAHLARFDRSFSVGHNYKPDDLARAWNVLLTSEASDTVWRDLTTENASASVVPIVAIPAFSKQLLARWESAKDEATRNRWSRILWSYRDVQVADLSGQSGLRDAIQSVITSSQHDLAALTFARLDSAVAAKFAAIGLEQFRTAKTLEWFRALVATKVPLGTDDWLAALSADRSTQLTALGGIPKGVNTKVTAAVEALLASSDASVRKEACVALTRIAGVDAVGLLLPVLQDETEFVRKAVRELLAQMREEQEQRNFWARVGDVELTTASAAAKLITQAMPGEEKTQRLLAIRSLALLNTPESLPYLIDWTKDKDREVQEAAKNAIATIHQKGGTLQPAKKK